MTLGSSLYVFAFCGIALPLSFLAAVPLRKFSGIFRKVPEAYAVTSLAALLAVVYSVLILGAATSWLNFAIYLPTIPAIYLGAKVYTATWRMVDQADRQAFDA